MGVDTKREKDRIRELERQRVEEDREEVADMSIAGEPIGSTLPLAGDGRFLRPAPGSPDEDIDDEVKANSVVNPRQTRRER